MLFVVLFLIVFILFGLYFLDDIWIQICENKDCDKMYVFGKRHDVCPNCYGGYPTLTVVASIIESKLGFKLPEYFWEAAAIQDMRVRNLGAVTINHE